MCTEQAGNGAKPGTRAGIRDGGFPWAKAGGMASPSARQENPEGSPECLVILSFCLVLLFMVSKKDWNIQRFKKYTPKTTNRKNKST